MEALSRAAAQHVVSHIDRALSEQEHYTLALAGGSTPRRLYELLAEGSQGTLPWERVHLFWGDERFVPPDHAESNTRLVRESLIDSIDIPHENVHSIPTVGSPEEAAQAYTRTLQSFFDAPAETFDAVLLGLGSDGHTASLFPGSLDPDRSSGDAVPPWVRVVEAPAEYDIRTRITCSLPVLNGAGQALFLVSGQRKRQALARVLEGDPSLPATHVRPRSQLSWFVDTDARPEDLPLP